MIQCNAVQMSERLQDLERTVTSGAAADGDGSTTSKRSPVCGHDTQAQPHHPPHPQQLQVGILPLPAALRLLLSICRETPIWCSYASLSVIWSLTADKPRLKSLSMAP